MEREAVEVIVADIGTPELDAVGLLGEVAKRYPRTIRLAFSNPSDRDLVLACTRVAHRFLWKPCDGDTLVAAIDATCKAGYWLKHEAVRQLIAEQSALPGLPPLHAELLDKLQSPNPAIETIAQLIAQDVGLATELLKLANSAFFGVRRRVASLTDAVMFLGLETVKSLLLWLRVFSQFPVKRIPGFSLQALSNHSLFTGLLAREFILAEKPDQRVADEAFTAGLLHDLGKLVFASFLPDDYARILAQFEAGGPWLPQAEYDWFGATHAEAGAYLIGLWGLPVPVVDAVSFHHEPAQCPMPTFGPLTAVHVANVLEHETHSQETSSRTSLDMDYLDTLGLCHRLDTWRAKFGLRREG